MPVLLIQYSSSRLQKLSFYFVGFSYLSCLFISSVMDVLKWVYDYARKLFGEIYSGSTIVITTSTEDVSPSHVYCWLYFLVID